MVSDSYAFGLPPKYQRAVTASDSVTLPQTYRGEPLRGLKISNVTGGTDLVLRDWADNDITYTVVAGEYYDFLPRYVKAATTATVVAWYG